MPMQSYYPSGEPSRAEVDAMPGPVLIEFGAPWCPHCQGIQSDLADLLDHYSRVRHIKVEDGQGKPLGRSFRVKLWPNLVFLRDGQVVQQSSRPTKDEVVRGLEAIGAPDRRPFISAKSP
jgi:thioredoxin 1